MVKGIIFDFVRTLYDPEVGRLFPEVLVMLRKLRRQGLRLGLISFGSEEKRRLVQSLGLLEVLHWVRVVPEKKPAVFQEFLSEFGFPPQEILVVGDRLEEEIAVGQSLGMKTVWLRVGKFSPGEGTAKPDFIVSSVTEVADLVEGVFQTSLI